MIFVQNDLNAILLKTYVKMNNLRAKQEVISEDEVEELSIEVEQNMHNQVAVFWGNIIMDSLGIDPRLACDVILDIKLCEEQCKHTADANVELMVDAPYFHNSEITLLRLLIPYMDEYLQEIYEYLMIVADESEV